MYVYVYVYMYMYMKPKIIRNQKNKICFETKRTKYKNAKRDVIAQSKRKM